MAFESSITNNPGSEQMTMLVANMKSQSTNIRTGFLFCPRCGLRRPKSENLDYYGGHCPYCGYRMTNEYYIPYNSRKSEPLLFSRLKGDNKMRHMDMDIQNQSSDNSI